MNTDCIFNILLYGNPDTIFKCLIACKDILKNNNTEYLYKLLYERDFITEGYMFNKSWHEKYTLYNNLNKLRNKLNINMTLYNLYITSIYNLSTNSLISIPTEIGELVHVKNILLNDNRLISIPREICNLINLCNLHLYNNKLIELPKEIGNLINLQKFYCHNNKLTKLPKEIGNLINLQKFIILYDNKLTDYQKK